MELFKTGGGTFRPSSSAVGESLLVSLDQTTEIPTTADDDAHWDVLRAQSAQSINIDSQHDQDCLLLDSPDSSRIHSPVPDPFPIIPSVPIPDSLPILLTAVDPPPVPVSIQELKRQILIVRLAKEEEEVKAMEIGNDIKRETARHKKRKQEIKLELLELKLKKIKEQ